MYLYDLTSTYFEGQCPRNPRAQRGYSRDHRPDCKQVVVGLVLDRHGFPTAHDVFDGHRVDRTTLVDMLTTLEARTGRRGGAAVVVDRGMAFADNLQAITDRGYHYLVAGRQAERTLLPATNGHTLRIRKGSTPEATHRETYRTLQIPHDVMKPVKTWTPTESRSSLKTLVTH